MADKLKMTVDVDKEVIKSLLVLGGGMKDGTPTEKVKQWLESHDSVDLKKEYLDSLPDENAGTIAAAMGAIATLAIANELKNEKEA